MIDISKCKLTKFPAKVLQQKALPIEQIDETVRLLADKMLDLMVESEGIGLAAPQANIGVRMFVVSLDGTRENATVFINPEIVSAGSAENMQEGCLSVPGIYTNINRPTKVTVKALDLEGKEFTIEADGLLAKCLQHEYDHLEGKTIIDRMSKVAKIRFRRALANLKQQEA